ncbi:MAG: LemA family protein [bacterium]|nr:LemA family protein [candidate division KSB1 bacterium]MDH7560238.1 LemA family protein [bacterium]
MRKTGSLVLIVIIVVILFLGLRGCSTYNALVSTDEEVKAVWAQVENQYQRRYDLIPNLVETVKGYAAHERETLIAVTEARAKVGQARRPQEVIEANDQLSSALARLLVVVERYPELKANENFIRLQDELAGTENRIAVERRRYTEVVQKFNTMVRRFPTNIIAGLFNFKVRETFEAVSPAREAPRVDFGRGGR